MWRRQAVSPAAGVWSASPAWLCPRAPFPLLAGEPCPSPSLAQPAGSPGDPPHESAVSVCSILVVDDEATIRQTVSEALMMFGYTVMTARNGAEALAAAEETHPHVVLLDLRMPVMDGWEFARVARQRQLGAKIVVMTATTDARRQAEDLAADAFLAKPFGIDQLLDVIERICGER
jgi:CheY-like chemotaxis protein